jgi:predicted GNAT family acetyltransferase
VLARVDGEPVAAAAWTPVIDTTSEIVGVATAEAWRRRGLAGAVTAAAARAAFAAGASLCVLSPGDETAQRVYERAGFRRVATMLHWSDPD